jgi:hypothetical protein
MVLASYLRSGAKNFGVAARFSEKVTVSLILDSVYSGQKHFSQPRRGPGYFETYTFSDSVRKNANIDYV